MLQKCSWCVEYLMFHRVLSNMWFRISWHSMINVAVPSWNLVLEQPYASFQGTIPSETWVRRYLPSQWLQRLVPMLKGSGGGGWLKLKSYLLIMSIQDTDALSGWINWKLICMSLFIYSLHTCWSPKGKKTQNTLVLLLCCNVWHKTTRRERWQRFGCKVATQISSFKTPKIHYTQEGPRQRREFLRVNSMMALFFTRWTINM